MIHLVSCYLFKPTFTDMLPAIIVMLVLLIIIVLVVRNMREKPPAHNTNKPTTNRSKNRYPALETISKIFVVFAWWSCYICPDTELSQNP